jgi:AbrB family looped-hinge helix DNA binding protein
MSRKLPRARIVRSLRNGQMTIPAEFRKQLGIEGQTLLQVSVAGDELRIKPIQVREPAWGSPWLKAAYEAFASVLAQTDRYSEEEIDSALDEAVRAVRNTDSVQSRL